MVLATNVARGGGVDSVYRALTDGFSPSLVLLDIPLTQADEVCIVCCDRQLFAPQTIREFYRVSVQ
jgi:hypothetical protein